MQETTVLLAPDEAGIARAAALLAGGQLVAFPTETVYGLGADARDDRAVAGIYAAKGRPVFNPLIVHVADLAAVEKIAVLDDAARALAQEFWPGALTLVLPLRDGAGLSRLVSAGLPSVALRVPAHPVARALITAFGGPVAAPSANPSGRISPTTAAHVMDGLAGRIAAVVDGGATPVGVESTIIGLDGREPALLRPGGVSVEDIARVIGRTPVRPGPSERPSSPGQLLSHYAPLGTVRLDATEARAGEVMLGFGSVDGALNLSPSGDLVEAAANLFAMLHDLDEAGAVAICVAPIPQRGLGVAINDRLARAAAPRA